MKTSELFGPLSDQMCLYCDSNLILLFYVFLTQTCSVYLVVGLATINEPHRDHLLQRVSVWLFWMAPKCGCCLHNCTNKSYQGGKWTWAQFKQTKQRRCENTLRRPIESSSPLQKDVSQMSLLIATDCDCLETSCLLPGELCNRLGIKRSVGWPLGYHNYLQSVPDFS